MDLLLPSSYYQSIPEKETYLAKCLVLVCVHSHQKRATGGLKTVILQNACCKTKTFSLPGYILPYVPQIEWERVHGAQGKVFSSLLIVLGPIPHCLIVCIPLNTCLRKLPSNEKSSFVMRTLIKMQHNSKTPDILSEF